jgi:dihydropteroate synthase
MHARGTPQTMQQLTDYEDFMSDITDFFQRQIFALRQKGVKDIIIDPGFGFAKTLDQNFELLRKLPLLKALDCPILVGVSRKSMIYKALDITPETSLNGTTALHALALEWGASILRVHDVAEARQCIRLWQKTL